MSLAAQTPTLRPVSSAVSCTAALPTLGVVVVNYNYQRFVADAIESLLNQQEPFDCIVVVDDGSTDRSLSAIRSFEPRITVIAKPNGGQLSATRAGLDAIATDYLYVLDADDYAAPDLVRVAKPALAARPAKLQFQLTGVDEQKRPLGSVFPRYPHPYGSREAQADNAVTGFYISPVTSGNIYRTDLLRSLDLALIQQHEPLDGSPALAFPYLGEILSLNHPLAFYRVHGAGHSQWDRPDDSLLQFETEWFARRWADVCRLLALPEPPFQNRAPLYLLERAMMRRALSNSLPSPAPVARYLRRLLQSHHSPRQKAMLSLWAISTLAPAPRLRRSLVLSRRSPLNRPSIFKWLVNRSK